MDELEAPVAHRRPLTEPDSDVLRLVERELDVLEEFRFRPLQLLGRRSGVRGVLDDTGQGEPHAVHRLLPAQLRERHEVARLAQLERKRAGARGQLGVDERLVQPPGGRCTEDLGEYVHGRIVGVRARWNVVAEDDDLHFTHAAQHRDPLAILRRLLGVRGVEQHPVRERAHGARNGPELLLDERERPRFVQAAGDDEHRVVGLIVLVVEDLQPVGRDPFDVRLVADGRLAVVVPEVPGGHHALEQHPERRILARLELIAHDAELLLELVGADVGVHEPVGLEIERPVQVRVGRGDGLEVVGAVVPRGPVPLRAVVAQLLGHVLVSGRALEDHVLEQVRHPGLAVPFVARTDHHGEVHGDRRFCGIGDNQYMEPVG